MFKYSLEFRQNAIELVKKIGITKACKELNVAPVSYTHLVQALIIKYDAERLSDIAPEHYASLLAEAEGL